MHANRNGFNYTVDRHNGQFLKAVQYAAKVTWTKGIDPKTGKPVDYDPAKDVQNFAIDWKGGTDVLKNACPDVHGGTNFWPPAYSQKTRLLYIGGNEGCANITPDPTAHVQGKFGGGDYVNEERITGSLSVVDPASGEFKMRKELPYANHSGVLATAGGIVVTALLDGTIVAYDDQTLEELWKINVGIGLRRAAHDLRGGRQAIHRHRLRHRRGRPGQARALAGDEDHCRTPPCCSCSGCNSHEDEIHRGSGRGCLRAAGRHVARARGRRHLRAPAQSRAAELAHEPSRLRRAALLAARHDQQVEREEPQARLRRGARRHLGNENLLATPLVDDGFMYMVDAWGVVYKIDVRSGTMRPHRLEDGSRPGKDRPQPRRRAVGQSRHLRDQPRRPRHRDRQGDRQDRLGQEPARPARHDAQRGAACACRTRSSSAPRAATRACATGWSRSTPRPATCMWKTYAVPAPGEPGSETWKDKNNAWQTGGGAFYVTGSYDPDTNITYWGAGNPAPKYDSSYRPGDNLYTNSALAIDAATGKIRWYHQYTPNDTMDYDETGSHILIDTKVNGEDRKIVTQCRAQRLRL